jgi:ribosomal peptide maturation radical SAM protein 1
LANHSTDTDGISGPTEHAKRSLALVAMPWSIPERPSAALGCLAAYVRREAPAWRVTTHYAYVDCASILGFADYNCIALHSYILGEPLYQPLLYPERREESVAWLTDLIGQSPATRVLVHDGREARETVLEILAKLDAHVDAVVESLVGVDVVGLTTCFGQLFANLLVAKRLKEKSPRTRVVLGGSTVSGRVGPSILREYAFIDDVVQGEGEMPLVGLLSSIEAGETRPIAGLISRRGPRALLRAELSEVPRLDDLPMPDYDAYAAAAEAIGLEWVLALEGSRGCWWDRTKRSGNPASTCYFCNLNVQWNGYREKSTERVVEELATLSERYGVLDIFFLDNIIRVKGVADLARDIRALRRDFRIFYELRANLSQADLLAMYSAGLRKVQYGVEGLSTSFLRRIGKGTSTIQNLAAMKSCEELGIENVANLIMRFPGATEAEIDETVRNIERYAVAYKPLDTVTFHLGVESTVEVLRERFKITGVRNGRHHQAGLPPDVFERLDLLDLEFECDDLSPSWSRVEEAAERWRSKFASMNQPMLMYQDGGSFLKITDLRGESSRSGMLRGLEREVYLHACDIRTAKAIYEHFPRHRPEDIDQVLAAFVDEDLMFHEDGRYLSLAMAPDTEAAIRRMTEHARHEPRRALSVLAAQ